MKKEKKIFPELFSRPKDSFDNHLALNENYRILLSGRFGIGKTTFLNYYFEKHNDKYNVIHLYPVNYSLLENEDIFSYIKYDILVSLLANHEYPLKPDYYSFLNEWDGFMLDNLGQVIATTMLLIPKLGKQLNQFAVEMKRMASDFKKFKRSKEDSEMDEISNFLSQFHKSEGGIYESNIVTLIIREWLNDITSFKKENILIIDDLDRIDPTHIFRLLNIFSAHFDNRDRDESKNKFGFSKVIFVCDIDNIKSIYQNQFGLKTDFNGYLDKFYSKEIFRFDNRNNVISILDQIIKSLELVLNSEDRNIIPLHPDSDLIKQTINIILTPLVQNNSINLRSLFKFYDKSINIDSSFVQIHGVKWMTNENSIISALFIISMFIGDFRLLTEKLKNLPSFIIGKDANPPLFVGDLIMLIDSINASVIKEGLWHSTSEIVEFNLSISKEKRCLGEYYIYPPSQGKKVFSGYLNKLDINSSEVNLNFRDNRLINIHDILIKLIDNIII